MKIIKTKKFILRPLKMSDKKALVENVNNKKITDRLLVVPYPYTLKDAEKWIRRCQRNLRKKVKNNIVFGIEINGKVVGSIGIHDIAKEHKATIGYWLGEKYWGSGIMSEVIKIISNFCFKELKLKRVEAGVFLFNPASKRVLEKNGFKLEGIIKKGEKKGNKFIDIFLMAKVK